MTIADVLFSCLGVIAGASALFAVTTQRVVHAALWLTLSMTALTGCFLVLGAELVALVQLLVYVGAVVVLVLFAIMMTRSPVSKAPSNSVGMAGRASAFMISAATGGLLFAAFHAAFGNAKVKLTGASTQVLSENLFARFSWPFEVLSLVLLAALVGGLAMVTASRTQPKARPTDAAPIDTPATDARGADTPATDETATTSSASAEADAETTDTKTADTAKGDDE